MLKEFRSIDVYWDKATRRIYEEIRSSSSDEKGRKLTVQIVNDGQIQDLTNVALNLYWETQDGENRGLDSFEPLDPENGLYELYFRTGMLQHVGKLNAHLHLVDTTGAITSEPFTIFVFEGVDVDAMASEDELSALTQALVQVNNLETTYAPRLNAVEGSVDSLTDDVALNKSNIVSNTQDIVNLDGRLTTVEQNIEFLNFRNSLSTITGVTNLTALKMGRLHMITFMYKPTDTGFTTNVVSGIPAAYRPANSIAASVGTHDSTLDSAKGISAVLRPTSGAINVVAPTAASYDMTFSFVWIA